MKKKPAQAVTTKVYLNSHNKLRYECIKDDFINQTDNEAKFYMKPRSKELVKFIYLYTPHLINPARESDHPEIAAFKQNICLEKYKGSPFESLEKPQLIKVIHELMIDQVFQCYTRQALPIIWEKSVNNVKWLVFFDIDDLHTLNETLGYENVDRRITSSLKMRQDGSTIVRWYSGDEFLVLGMSGDYKGFIKRIKQDLAEHGLSATFAGCNKKSTDYKILINKLIEKVATDKTVRHTA